MEYGFRLPSAVDNRPLTFDEFERRLGTVLYTSATPADYEMKKADQVVEQIIRPTGLVDPQVEVRPIEGQVDDLIGEINKRVAQGERVLVTTLTKRMAEDLSEYLLEMGVKVHYLHSEVETLGSHQHPCATCAWASSTWLSASTCCAKVWTCQKCPWSPSWTPISRVSCAPRRR